MTSGTPAVNKKNRRAGILLRCFRDPVKIKSERRCDDFKKQAQEFDNKAFKNWKKPNVFSPLAVISFGSEIDRIIPDNDI